MQNSVIFLGTSHGDPSLTRFCSSTLYMLNGTRILVDAGEPVSALLLREGILPSSLDAVFLTHMHVDHANGLGALCCQIVKYPDRKVEMYFSDPRSIDPFMQWNGAMKNHFKEQYLEISSVSPDFVWQKNGVSIRPIPTEHMGPDYPSYAYVIETPQYRIFHTGDLTADFHDFPLTEKDAPFDLCVCEATHIWNHKEIFIEKLSKVPIKRLVLNHIGPFWTDGKEDSLRELVSVLPYPVVIASDGTHIDMDF